MHRCAVIASASVNMFFVLRSYYFKVLLRVYKGLFDKLGLVSSKLLPYC